MNARGVNTTIIGTVLGVAAPMQAAAVQSFTDWRDWIKDYNLAIAGITATVIALWWVIRLVRYAHESYLAIFARPPRRSEQNDLDNGD